MNTATRFYERGIALLESDPRRAIYFFSASLNLTPDAPNVLYDRAVAYARIGAHADAVADIGRLQRVAPEIGRRLETELALGAEPYVDLARSKYMEGDFLGAIKNCELALAYDRGFVDAWIVKGAAFVMLDDAGNATRCYTIALAINPTNLLALINRAEIQRRGHRFEEALSDYSRAIELSPSDPRAYAGRCAVNTDLGLRTEAEADAARAANLKIEVTQSNNGLLVAN